jgi:hypothetical protein
MRYKFFRAITVYLLFSIALQLTGLVILPTYAQAGETRGATCVNSQATEKKYVGVEYLDSGNKFCRTIYSDGVSPTREIAWAQNSAQKCEEVAGNLLAKLSRAGMSCNGNQFTKAYLNTVKPAVKLSKEDAALLKSIPK